MPDDTSAALQALIQQVTKLTETVDAQAKRLDDLCEFNGRVLDDKKDVERAAAAERENFSKVLGSLNAEEQARKLKALGLVKGDDGNLYLQGARPEHSITRSDARNPRKYRAAKEAAAKAGKALTVLDESDGDPTIRNTRQSEIAKTATFQIDDTHEGVRWLRADMHKGDGIVRRTQLAEQAGLRIKTWRTPDELPQHVQTKFQLMEKAHAPDDNG